MLCSVTTQIAHPHRSLMQSSTMQILAVTSQMVLVKFIRYLNKHIIWAYSCWLFNVLNFILRKIDIKFFLWITVKFCEFLLWWRLDRANVSKHSMSVFSVVWTKEGHAALAPLLAAGWASYVDQTTHTGPHLGSCYLATSNTHIPAPLLLSAPYINPGLFRSRRNLFFLFFYKSRH
jgi:hypothetical protein